MFPLIYVAVYLIRKPGRKRNLISKESNDFSPSWKKQKTKKVHHRREGQYFLEEGKIFRYGKGKWDLLNWKVILIAPEAIWFLKRALSAMPSVFRIQYICQEKIVSSLKTDMDWLQMDLLKNQKHRAFLPLFIGFHLTKIYLKAQRPQKNIFP